MNSKERAMKDEQNYQNKGGEKTGSGKKQANKKNKRKVCPATVYINHSKLLHVAFNVRAIPVPCDIFLYR